MCDETLYSRLSVKKASLKASIGYGSKQEVWAKIECLIFCTDVLVQKFLTSPSLMPPPTTHTQWVTLHIPHYALMHTRTHTQAKKWHFTAALIFLNFLSPPVFTNQGMCP